MKKIKATRLGKNGNCFQACIASFLNLSLDEVPDFCSEKIDWDFKFYTWLKEKNLLCVEIDIQNCKEPLLISFNQYCILTGKSPRGHFFHCAIGKYTANGFKFIFDPGDDTFFGDNPILKALFIGSSNYAKY